jgi:GNAT superfamily N-acetyltransferase
MAEVSVRPAGAADAAEIARLQLSTWRTAYGAVLPPGVLDRLTHDQVTARWSAAVQHPPSARHRVLVALDGPSIAGFAALGPADDDAADAAVTGLISTLLVEPRWGRRGHGSRLLAASVDLMREDGDLTALTWLLEQDRISRSFFTATGWATDGSARTLDMNGRFVTEVRLHTDLSGSRPTAHG